MLERLKMWGEVTRAPYGKINIEIWRGRIGIAVMCARIPVRLRRARTKCGGNLPATELSTSDADGKPAKKGWKSSAWCKSTPP